MEHLTSAATLIMVNLPYSHDNFKFNEEALKGRSSYRLDDRKYDGNWSYLFHNRLYDVVKHNFHVSIEHCSAYRVYII